ncbi:MAG: 2OG-Fe(II) oxygenase [Candidatus Nanopelagicaceae bacterium]
MEAKDFILKIDDAISINTCKKIIELFENNYIHSERIVNQGAPNFTQLNVNKQISNLVPPLSGTILKHLNEYKKQYSQFAKYFPPKICLEEFRIKCYNSQWEDRFDLHVDVTDKSSSIRFLSFLYYLNEDFSGGETVFPEQNFVMKPKTGSLIIFPPTWQYPHIGNQVMSGKKYIMSTYLHYY